MHNSLNRSEASGAQSGWHSISTYDNSFGLDTGSSWIVNCTVNGDVSSSKANVSCGLIRAVDDAIIVDKVELMISLLVDGQSEAPPSMTHYYKQLYLQ